MADIKQAAKWMAEGRTVCRKKFESLWWVFPYEPYRDTFGCATANGADYLLTTADLLAEDWELV